MTVIALCRKAPAAPGLSALGRWARQTSGKRPGSAPRSALDRIRGFPGPRQQLVDAVYGVSIDHAREHVMQVGVGLDVIKLAAFNQRTQHGPSVAAAIAAGEEVVLTTEGDRPDCALNRIGMCALPRRTVLPGENPGRQTLARCRPECGWDSWRDLQQREAI